MKFVKRLVISILMSVGFLGSLSIYAEGETLEIVYYNPLGLYDDIVLEFFDLENEVVLATFESEALQMNNKDYISFTTSYLPIEPTLLRLTYFIPVESEEPPLLDEETDEEENGDSDETLDNKEDENTDEELPLDDEEPEKIAEIIYIDFVLDEAFMQESTYQYYLRDGLFFKSLEELITKIEYASFSNSYVVKFKTNFDIPVEGTVQLLHAEETLPVTNLRKIDEYYFFNTDDVNIKFEYVLVIDFLESDLLEYQVRFDGIYDKGFFISNYTYLGDDLGIHYTPSYTDFKLWAPLLSHVKLNIYTNNTKTTYTMQEGNYGVFSYRLFGNHKDKEYTYSFSRFGNDYEVIDPYALLLNSQKTKGVIPALDTTDPFGFRNMESRSFNGNYLEAVIYESSVHQMTGDQTVYGQYTNTFLGLSRQNTSYNHNGYDIKTGIAHLTELGITHVSLSDLFDFSHSLRTVNQDYQFVDGPGRNISELKTLVKQFNDADIGLIATIDVSLKTIDALEILTPGYYYEHQDGEVILDEENAHFNFENKMVKLFVMSSLKYLVEEFSLSGIKLIPLNTFFTEDLNEIQQTLLQINDTIIVYGEFSTKQSTTHSNRVHLNALRSISKIGVVDARFTEQNHFISGGSESIKSYLLKEPVAGFNTYTLSQAFNTLPAFENFSSQEQTQAAYMTLLAFGTPIIKAGEEFNYSGDILRYINKLYGQQRFEGYQSLIDFRKRHVSMRLDEHRDVKNLVEFKRNEHLISIQITNLDDQYPDILILFNNALDNHYTYTLPVGLNTEEKRLANQGDFDWKIVFSNVEPTKTVYQSEEEITLLANQTVILHFGEIKDNIIIPPTRVPEKPQENSNTWMLALIGIGIGIIVLGFVGTYFIIKNPKDSNKATS